MKLEKASWILDSLSPVSFSTELVMATLMRGGEATVCDTRLAGMVWELIKCQLTRLRGRVLVRMETMGAAETSLSSMSPTMTSARRSCCKTRRSVASKRFEVGFDATLLLRKRSTDSSRSEASP